jgi:PAS domain S-box-containing protein
MISVLYVDDELALLDVGKRYLERIGNFKVDTSGSAHIALEKIKATPYDAVVSDYQMPGMDGIQLLQALRSQGNSIPFIIFTGRGREEVVIEALNSGADFYLQKGGAPAAQFAELAHKIRLAVQMKTAQKQMDEIVQGAPIPEFVIDNNHHVIFWNRALEEYSGIRAADIVGTDQHWRAFYPTPRPCLADLLVEGTIDAIPQWYEGKYAVSSTVDNAFEARDYFPKIKGGSWLFFTAAPIHDNSGHIIGAVETLQDITAMRKKEEELQAAYEQMQAAFIMAKTSEVALIDQNRRLEESEKRYHTVVETQTEFICRFHPDGTHVFVNEAYCRYFGKKRDEIVGHIFIPKIPEEDQNVVREHFRSFSPDSPVATIAHRIILQNGEVRWQRWSDRAIFDDNGLILEYQSVGRDVTEQKLAEESLKLVNERMRQLLASTSSAIYTSSISRDYGATSVTDNVLQITGYEPREFLENSRFWIDHVHPEDKNKILDDLPKISEKNFHSYEYRFQCKDGKYIWILDEMRLSQNEEGKAREIIGQWRDITERKQAEEALRESEKKYRDIIENIQDVVYRTDKNGKLTMFSPYGVKLAGYDSESEMIGLDVAADTYKDPKERLRFLAALSEKGFVENYPLVLKTKDERSRFVTTSSHFYYDDSGNVLGVEGIIHDITERVQAEEGLRESEIERWQAEDRLARINDTLICLGSDHRENIQSLITLCGELLGADSVIYNKLEGDLLCVDGKWNCPPDFKTRDAPEGHICYDVISGNGNGPLVVCNLSASQYAQTDPNVAAFGLKTYIGHPVRYGEVIRGSLCAVFTRDIRPSPDDLKVIGILSTAVAQEEERMESGQALRESEEKYRRIIDTSLEGVWIVDTESCISYVNSRMAELLGYRLEELTGRRVADFIHPEDFADFIQKLSERRKGISNQFERRYIRKDGTIITLLVSATPIIDEDGTFRGSFAMFTDITDRKCAENALQESEENFRYLFENANESIFVIQDGKICFANPKILEIGGYTIEELATRPFLEFVHPDDRAIVGDQHNLRLAGYNLDESYTFRVLPKDGSVFWMEIKASLITYNKRPAVLVFLSDITDRRQAEEELRESETKLQMALFGSETGMWQLDIPSMTGAIDDRAAQILGYPQQDIGSHSTDWDTLSYPDDVPLIQKRLADYLEGHTTIFESEHRMRHATSEWRWVIGRGKITQRLLDGSPLQISGTVHDITERKRAEEALSLAMKKLNLLSSITRHDINNQLTILQGYLGILEDTQLDSSQNECFLKVTTAAERIAGMIQFTKEYEDIGVNTPVWNDLCTLINTAAKEALLGKVIVKNDLPAGTEMFADPLIFKVFHNLIDNAVRHGGKISTIRLSIEECDGNHAIVCEDDGVGVPEDEKEKIFEPGFGKNTGLGLALSREILSMTGISICETGEPGQGTRFEIAVPKGAWRLRDLDV